MSTINFIALPSRSVALLALALALAASSAACGSSVSPDAGGDVAPGADAADSAADTSTAPDAALDAALDVTPMDAPADTPADASVDVRTDAPADVPPSDATTSATVTLRDFSVYGNCMPIVPADPIGASWTADVRGARGTSATLRSATLTITGARTVTQTLTVDQPVVTLTSGAGSQAQRKTSADANPTGACGELCSGSTAALDVHFTIDGADVTAHASTSYGCAF